MARNRKKPRSRRTTSQVQRRYRRNRNRNRRRNNQRINSRRNIHCRQTEARNGREALFSSHSSMLLINKFLSECEANLETCDEQHRFLNQMLVNIQDHSRSLGARQSQMSEMFQPDTNTENLCSFNGSQNAVRSIPESGQTNEESGQDESNDEQSFPVTDRIMIAADHDVFVVPVGTVHLEESTDSNVLILTITLNKDTDEVQVLRRSEDDKSE